MTQERNVEPTIYCRKTYGSLNARTCTNGGPCFVYFEREQAASATGINECIISE